MYIAQTIICELTCMSLKLEIENLLWQIDGDFHSPLSLRLNIADYAEKMAKNATIFSVYDKETLTAFAAVYCNDSNSQIAYLTMIAVAPGYRERGLGSNLIEASIRYLKRINFKSFKLEVDKKNINALAMYQRFGFNKIAERDDSIFMEMKMT